MRGRCEIAEFLFCFRFDSDFLISCYPANLFSSTDSRLGDWLRPKMAMFVAVRLEIDFFM